MRKTRIVVLGVLLISLICGFLYVESASAVSYYNWIQNYSFEQYGDANCVSDPSFTEGDDELWYTDGWVYKTDTGRTDLGSAVALGTSADFLWNHDWIANVSTDDIVEFSFWARLSGDQTAISINVKVYYVEGGTSDATEEFTPDDFTGSDASVWTKFNVGDIVSVSGGSTLYAINFDCTAQTGSTAFCVDDVYCAVVEASEGQDEINLTTSPWKSPNNYGYVAIHDDFGYTGDHSAYLAYYDYASGIHQYIDYMDSDSFVYMELMLYCNLASHEGTVIAYVVYSDGTWDWTSEDFDDSGWQNIIFDNFVDTNKYITMVKFNLGEYVGDNVCFDDVCLWSTQDNDNSRVDFTFSPSPISYDTVNVEVYKSQTYTVYGFVYDSVGDLNVNGTYSVTHTKGTVNGTVSNGLFQFTMYARSFTGYENVGIVVYDEDAEEYIFVNLNFLWVDGSSGTGTGTGSSGDSVVDNVNFWNYIVWFAIVFAPPAMLGGAGGKEGWGAQGFLIGLAISTSAGLLYLQVPFWIVFLISMGMAIMLFTMIRKS